MRKLIFSFLFGSLLVLFPKITFAGGIQVSPANLEISLQKNESKTVNITVANPTDSLQIFEVYPDAYEKEISVNPRSFTLEAGGRKVVSITIKSASSTKKSSFVTNLSVVGKPLTESEVQANTGVKIPISVSSLAKTENKRLVNIWLPLGAICALTIWIFYDRRKQKKPTENQS